MYQFSRAIYRELADEILEDRPAASGAPTTSACCAPARPRSSAWPPTGTTSRRPARTLFNDIRIYFPMSAQAQVYSVVDRYIALAREYFARQPATATTSNGNPLQCRATTRKGTPCQRMPLPHNGYCPSHQHLAETEEVEASPLARVATRSRRT